MRKIFILPFFLFLVLSTRAQDYYADAVGLNGYALKTKLHDIISKGTHSYNYDSLPYYYTFLHKDNYYDMDGSLLDIYSEHPTEPDAYNYFYSIPSLVGGASEEGLGWNREHIFSQSFFYGKYPMYSDMHFVVPTDARVNQRRSNLPFGKVGTATWTSINGSKVGLSSSPGYSLTVFEPIDEFKGDIARMLLYVAVRYETLIPFFQYTNNRCPYEERQEKAIKDWQLAVLKEWHQADPVSLYEQNRNDSIAGIQLNRNPFIDHPEWVEAIWPDNPVIDSMVPETPIYLSVDTIGKSFITLSWDVSSMDNILGYKVYLNDSAIDVSRRMQYTFTGLDSNTTYQMAVQSYNHSYIYSPKSSVKIATTAMADTFASDLIISKVIHGTGFNKAIELTNKTGHDIDLRHYSLSLRQINASTGSLYWSSNGYQMEGYLPHNRKLVLMHPSFSLECFDKNDADVLTDATPMRIDGVLALALYNGNNRIDLFGNAENSSDTFLRYKSFYRKDEYKNPTITFDTIQWVAHETNYCDSLGNLPEPTAIAPQANHLMPFVVYPNPVDKDLLYFSGDDLRAIKWIKIYDMQGRVMIEQAEPFLTNHFINIHSLNAGIYFLSTNLGSVKILKR